MGKKPKTEILIKTVFSNAHGKQIFSSQCPVPKNLVNKSDLIIEFTLNSQGIQRLGLLRADKDNVTSWAYPLKASLPESGDLIGKLEVNIVDTKGNQITGGSCDVFGKAAEEPMVFEEHLIIGGQNRHDFENMASLATTGTPHLVGQTKFTLTQK